MKKSLFFLSLLLGGMASAQFQVKVIKDVKFATNVDFLTSETSNLTQVQMDITDLKTLVATNSQIPAKYYDPQDNTTDIKVTDLEMDIYEPTGDFLSERPLVIYLHTGNFLPPPANGSLAGVKTDSSAVEICTRLAERGFVAASMNYRLGWNPLASSAVERRALLLNAVYRAIHDTKEGVRFFRDDYANGNTYGVDTSAITLFGEGSGAYVALAYATLDKQSETEIQKFVFPGTQDSSYVQPGLVGDVNGYGGLLNLYTDQGLSADIDMVVNLGGALADTSWLEQGDAAMVSFHAVRDPYAPFGEGTVVVPTTGEDVVDVQGANVFMAKANSLGNNDGYINTTFSDSYTATAQAKYGNTYSYYLTTQPTITVGTNVEGLYPIVRPLAASKFENEGSPWQWWASGLSMPSPRSAAQAKTFIDTIMGYSVPRIKAALNLTIGVEETALSSKDVKIFPNPTSNMVTINMSEELSFNSIQLSNLNGRVIRNLEVNETQEFLYLSDLPAGIYLLSLEGESGKIVQRIIKQ